MFRKLTISLLVATVAILVFVVAVSAQGRGPAVGVNGDNNAGMMGMHNWQQDADEPWAPPAMQQQRMLRQTQDGTCANFIDEDGDGLCDNAGQSLGNLGRSGRSGGMMAGRGSHDSATQNDGTRLHRFGDGECDYETAPRDGTGNQFGQTE